MIKRIFRIIKVIPEPIKKVLEPVSFIWRIIFIKTQPGRHKKSLEIVCKNEKINVAFFLIHSSIWKYEGLYRLMEKDEQFNPVVIVCPYTIYGKENMFNEMQTSYNVFKEKQYNVIKTFNEDTGEWLDVKKQIKPDIIFFTNPHKLTKDQYYILNYMDCLTCYVPYGITHTHLQNEQYNKLIHNLVWKYFVETDIHRKMAIKFSTLKGKNTYVSGYPGVDAFFDKNYLPQDPWKIKNRNVKRIIWAPHHSLDENKNVLSYSNFIKFHAYIMSLAERYKNEIQISFKPHPLLKVKLYAEPDWGKARTDSYYESWNTLENGQLNESEYIDLFLTSDAMILDSGSFLNEYLCVNKPSMYIVRDKNLTDRFNDFGKMAFEFHYHGSNEQEIEYFIEKNVINENDELKIKREEFIKNYLMPPNNNSASQNILNHIKKELAV